MSMRPRVSDIRDLVDSSINRYYRYDLPIVLQGFNGGVFLTDDTNRITTEIDYVGIAYGHPVAFSCVNVTGSRAHFSDIDSISIELLFRFYSCGGNSFVLFYFRKIPQLYRIDIHDLIMFRKKGAESLDADEAHRIGKYITSNFVDEADIFINEFSETHKRGSKMNLSVSRFIWS